MKSGLEDRNNGPSLFPFCKSVDVSMKSGLEDRNNRHWSGLRPWHARASQ